MTVRTTTPKGAATRARIVDAAADLFHERGVEATGLGDVLDASGAGKSQLYHYFEGKAGLVDAVIDTQSARILAWHTALLADVTDVDGLRAWADTAVRAVEAGHGELGCPLGSLSAELADRSEAHRARVAAGFARWQEVLTAAVVRVTRGAGDRDPADIAAVLLTALQGGLLLANATHDVRHLRVGLSAAVDGVVGGAVDHGAPARPARRPRSGPSH